MRLASFAPLGLITHNMIYLKYFNSISTERNYTNLNINEYKNYYYF